MVPGAKNIQSEFGAEAMKLWGGTAGLSKIRIWSVLLVFLSLCELSAQQNPEKEREPVGNTKPADVQLEKKSTAEMPLSEDEISLVIKGKIISVTDKEIIYKETGSAVETRVPIQNLHFLRRANGEYRFFTPAKTELKEPTKVVTEEVKPKEPPPAKKVSSFEFFLYGGGVLHLARNSDAGDYMSGLASYVARSRNQANNSTGYSGQISQDAGKIQYELFLEPRVAYKSFMWGLQLGYAAFPKVQGMVSSATDANAVTLTLSGYFLPAFAISYYRIPLSQGFVLNLGIGAGLLHTSLKYSENDLEKRYTAWNAAALGKIEVSYQWGNYLVLFSAPFYFAESRKVESGSTALVNGDTGKVVSPNLTGFGFSVALGYQIF